MIRGTTPTLTFNLPFSASIIKSAFITLKSYGVEIEKSINDCKLSGESITTTLSQEETLMLTADKRVKVQLRVLTVEDVAMATPIYTVMTEDILKEGVIK